MMREIWDKKAVPAHKRIPSPVLSWLITIMAHNIKVHKNPPAECTGGPIIYTMLTVAN